MDRFGTHSGWRQAPGRRVLGRRDLGRRDPGRQAPGRRPLTIGEATRGVWALAVANARYWPTVAPLVRREIGRWEDRARAISDPALKGIATGKLAREHFNAQTAAILATAAPRAHRHQVAEAIVALQVAYDYLDTLGEQGIEGEPQDWGPQLPGAGRRDGGYLRELLETASERLAALPAAEAVTDVLHAAMERALDAQARAHGDHGPHKPPPTQADRDHPADPHNSASASLESWARAQAEHSGLHWLAWLAGAQASVLCAHALIAAAADPATTRADAEAIDGAYLAVGSVSMLDSLIDADEDTAAGQVSYLARYASAEQMGEDLAAAVGVAIAATRALPHAAHHQMLLAGLVAYYASAPAARGPEARTAMARVRSELRPLLTPALATMRIWRTAKLVPIVFALVIG